jgi:flagellar protein FliO/FliZ
MHIFCRSAFAFFFMGSAAMAQTLTDGRSGDTGGSLWSGAWLGVVTLVLMIGLVALVLWFFRTFNHRNTTAGVQVLASHALGPRDRILIVRIEDRILALGQTASQINLLTELESFETRSPPDAVDAAAFSGLLNKLVKRPRA